MISTNLLLNNFDIEPRNNFNNKILQKKKVENSYYINRDR